MPVQLFTNNANSTLAAPVGSGALSIQVATGDGALFPNPSGGDWFLATLCKVTSGVETNVEIVKVTARSTDVLTIVRAQEGTTAQTYTTGDRISLRMTAALANAIAAAFGLSGLVKVAAGAFAASVAGTDHTTPTGAEALTQKNMKNFGLTYYDSTTTNSLNVTNGPHQRWAPNTGAQTLSLSGWVASGQHSELMIEGVNLGASTITWPTINWVKKDGTFTTTIATYLTDASRTLQAIGLDFVFLWTRDGGTTIYGKLL